MFEKVFAKFGRGAKAFLIFFTKNIVTQAKFSFRLIFAFFIFSLAAAKARGKSKKLFPL